MRLCALIVLLVTFLSNIASSQTPPPLLARPRGAYYPHGINGEAIPLPDLFEAVMQNDKARVKDLLEHGANPNEPAPNGYAPLIQSTVWGIDPEICKLLVEHGADVNVLTPPNQKGFSKQMDAVILCCLQKAKRVSEYPSCTRGANKSSRCLGQVTDGSGKGSQK